MPPQGCLRWAPLLPFLLLPQLGVVVGGDPQSIAFDVRPGGRIMRVELHPAQHTERSKGGTGRLGASSDRSTGTTIHGIRAVEKLPSKPATWARELQLARTKRPAASARGILGLDGRWNLMPNTRLLVTDAADPSPLACHRVLPAKDIPSEQKCPQECPFLAEDGRNRGSCHFKCVKEAECGSLLAGVHENTSVPDPKGMVCRRCRSTGCKRCAPHTDECVECSAGYDLVDSKCVSSFWIGKYATLGVMMILFLYLLCWYVDLRCRPVVNEEGVAEALRMRSLSKLRMPKHRPPTRFEQRPTQADDARGPQVAATASETSSSSTRPLWPLSTNLLTSRAGGPGLALHFRYQVFIIVWAFAALLLWAVLASAKDPNIFLLGWKEVRTPRDMCEVVHWGHQLQKEIVWIKIAFLAVTYVVGFLACLGFSVQQLRFFQKMDDHTTMKDFGALLTNLPRLSGQDRVEEMLCELLSSETGERPVGISVCWDYRTKADVVMSSLDACIRKRDAALAAATTGAAAAPPDAGEGAEQPPPPGMGQPVGPSTAAIPPVLGPAPVQTPAPPPTAGVAPVHAPATPPARGLRGKLLGKLDQLFLDEGAMGTAWAEELDEEGIGKMVRSMESTSYAFAVFQTEHARDGAVSLLQAKGGMPFMGMVLHLERLECEPETVRWADFSVHSSQLPMRIVLGILTILAALVLWTVLFYIPYVLFIVSHSFDDESSEPAGVSNLIMSVVVVGGNMMLYAVCAMVSEHAGFHFEDDREAMYMVMYTAAVLLSVVLDMLVTGWISYKSMIGVGAHTFGGKDLQDLTNFQEIFESYPMQKALGSQLFYYCFPSCFLFPFIVEPLCAIGLHFHLARLVLRSYAGVVGHQAEKSMTSFLVMDTGRYADVLVNLTLAVLAFFVPSGYLVPTLGTLVGSHIYIYFYDHYRVLRCVPGFCYANATIDRCAQRLLAFPMGIVVACAAFKINDAQCAAGKFCLESELLTLVCVDAFVAHVVLHWLLLSWVVPKLGRQAALKSELTFDDAACTMPSTWFSANPVHCLRSRFFYEDSPACSYYVRGKEHTMEPSTKVHTHFQDKIAEAEDY